MQLEKSKTPPGSFVYTRIKNKLSKSSYFFINTHTKKQEGWYFCSDKNNIAKKNWNYLVKNELNNTPKTLKEYQTLVLIDYRIRYIDSTIKHKINELPAIVFYKQGTLDSNDEFHVVTPEYFTAKGIEFTSTSLKTLYYNLIHTITQISL
ncbi:hypothetical protein ACFLSU_02105 [Bacteroidota bacterium]